MVYLTSLKGANKITFSVGVYIQLSFFITDRAGPSRKMPRKDGIISAALGFVIDKCWLVISPALLF